MGTRGDREPDSWLGAYIFGSRVSAVGSRVRVQVRVQVRVRVRVRVRDLNLHLGPENRTCN